MAELRTAGLGTRDAFLLVQSYSQGCVTHLLRANYEDGDWTRALDQVFVEILQSLVDSAFNDEQKAQCFLRLADGGLGFSSAENAVAAAFLGSWALTLQGVARCLGVVSWQGFQARCQPVADSITRAETKLRQQGGESMPTVDWVGCLAEPRSKFQGACTKQLRKQDWEQLLSKLSEDNGVDFRSDLEREAFSK